MIVATSRLFFSIICDIYGESNTHVSPVSIKTFYSHFLVFLKIHYLQNSKFKKKMLTHCKLELKFGIAIKRLNQLHPEISNRVFKIILFRLRKKSRRMKLDVK